MLVRGVLRLAPLGVFALALPLAVRLGASAAGALAGYVVIVVAVTLVFIALLYPLAAIVGRVPIAEFARAALPPQAVAFSSRSSLAALPAMMESARGRLRLPESVAAFLLPLAASTYRPGATIGQMVGALFIAKLYGIELGLAQVATMGLTAVVTAFGVPGVPSGSIIMIIPVLAAAGVPVEGIGLLIGIDTIPDMFRTTSNTTGHMAAAVVVGRRVRDDAVAESAAIAGRAAGTTPAAR